MSIISRISARSITVIIEGRVRTISANSINYPRLLEALQETHQDPDLIKQLADIPAFMALETHGRVTVSGDEVRFDGIPIRSTLTERILAHLKAGISIKPLANFLDRLMNNPNEEIHDDLYAWCESGDMPFTDDGFLIAFKKVQDDYYSYYTGNDGKVLYELNTIVEIPSDEVDPDRYNECSNGLHFCSYDYLNWYHGQSGRILIVKIDPADVVAIPTDHNRQKGRTFRMEVIDEVASDEAAKIFEGRLVVDQQGSYTAGVESTATVSRPGVDPDDCDDDYDDEFGDDDDFWDPSDEDEEPAVEPDKGEIKTDRSPASDVVVKTRLSFSRPGSSIDYDYQDILAQVGIYGINGYARKSGIPRSTLQGWVKKARNEPVDVN